MEHAVVDERDLRLEHRVAEAVGERLRIGGLARLARPHERLFRSGA